jgi:hypothetical protein
MAIQIRCGKSVIGAARSVDAGMLGCCCRTKRAHSRISSAGRPNGAGPPCLGMTTIVRSMAAKIIVILGREYPDAYDLPDGVLFLTKPYTGVTIGAALRELMS